MPQTPFRIAFQGAPGAFSHEACRACLPSGEPVPFDTFEQALAAVRDGDCARGFIPIRNTSAGVVPEVAALLPTSGLVVVAEHPWPVHHQLMGVRGATLDDVEVVASHPMALKQCTRVLEVLGVRIEPAFDTAGAARDLARSGERTRAVVASRTAAELYGLAILRPDIEDAPDNTTWFAVLEPARSAFTS